ncbi:TonB-dependent receptor [Novosphingobium flavum]|uniref:TonB-dependent receptor n=1 Tax=Novosphingobium flavum TaxID=1778672 RepID=A0A7X1FRB7_9SPHN|nr:TonB-dependent receptor [Novosphingobium flavum]MBC2665394.1 TonB-dependent receptor [Novosphingobium flavum]
MKLKAMLCASAALVVVAHPAHAQTQQPAADSSSAEIIVTGSRVIQNGNDSPTPLTVVTTENLLAARPGNLAEAINDLPVFSGPRTQASNTGTSGAAGAPATSANAVNVINLRNMGLGRTLVLFDGHRMPPSTPDGFVDINTIPQMLLKRVDVVTGGVSAVYGSDGITGAVNFVTDTAFKGIKANAQMGISTYGDARSYDLGLAGGTDFADGRGHIMGSVQYRNDDGIDSKFARPWGNDVRTLQGSGTAASPYFQVIGARASNATFGGRINGGALNDMQFLGGAFVAFNHGTKTGQGGTIPTGQAFEIGGDGGYYNGQLRAALELKQAYARLDYDLSDDFKVYVSAAGTENHSVGIVNYYTNFNMAISRDNAFLNQLYPSVVTAMGSSSTFSLGKIFTEFPRGTLEATSRQLLTVAGLQGKLGPNWDLDLAYVRAGARFDVSQNAAINQGRLWAALDSVLVGGQAVCRAAATNPVYAGCVPLNPFGVGSASQAAINYIVQKASWRTNLHSDDVTGSIAGSPFSTWAGPVRLAFTGEWRRNSVEVISGALAADPSNSATLTNCTGVLPGVSSGNGGCNPNAGIYSNAAVNNLPKSAIEVTELAVEGQVPLLKDAPFFKTLDLNLAYRHAHYNLSGNANTWKVGLTWEPADWLTLRATRSRDFRAPNIDELFRPNTLTLTNFTDRISGADVGIFNTPTYNGGNPNLKPEIANTLTLGAVFKPPRNFSFSVDYFDIKVDNFIFLVQGNSTAEQDICYASKGTSPLCSLIVRGLGIYDPSNPQATSTANAVTAWYQRPINVAKQTTYGFDFEANWQPQLFGNPASVRLLATYQPHIRFMRTGDPVVQDYGGVAFGTNGIQATPKWRVTGFFTFKPSDQITVNLMQRWRSSLKFHSSPLVVVSSPNIRSVGYTNVGVSFAPKMANGRSEVYFNVANLFNTAPPQAGFWGNANPGQFGEFALGDDVIGRYFTAGVRFKF